MLRTFLLFLGIGVASQILFAWTAGAGWFSDIPFALMIFAPAVAAVIWWHQNPLTSFWFAALGVAASGLVGYGIYWWRHVRNFSCPPGDFECLTVGSQSGENFAATVLITVVSIAFTAAGAFIGARSAPKEAI
jgi:cellulose synthase/poly-beta-1,6-N-acetylglucosamine synthase-like glycosyltransferase